MAAPARTVLAGRYELGELLGRGGMAFVYRGTDRVLGRPVAIKVLAPALAGDPKAVERFRREAQAAAALSHPGIVTVFDTGSEGDVHYIVMELVEGRSLSAILAERGRLRPETAAAVAARVAGALAYAHDAGVVHRDVKPGNIMVTEGRVKVMDFGIARVLSSHTLTDTAAILGTASYLAPEQAQGRGVDPRSDVYALGVVLYQMLTGRPPFVGDSPVAVAIQHVGDEPPPPTQLNPAVPADLETEAMRALAKDPAERHGSAREFAERLDAIREGLVAGGSDAGEETLQQPASPADDDAAPPPKRRWVRLGALAAFLLAGVVSIAFMLPEPSATRDQPNDQANERSEPEESRRRQRDASEGGDVGTASTDTGDATTGPQRRGNGGRSGQQQSDAPAAPSSGGGEPKEAPDPPDSSDDEPTDEPTEGPTSSPSPTPVPSPTDGGGSTGTKGSAEGA